MPPVTSAPLNRTWLRLTRRNTWTPASATVFSRDWTSREPGNDAAGHWHVVYEYSVDGERYIGRFADFASGDEDYLWPGQTIAIRYNPRRPSQSYYPERRTQTGFLVLCIVMAVVMAVLLLLVSFPHAPAR